MNKFTMLAVGEIDFSIFVVDSPYWHCLHDLVEAKDQHGIVSISELMRKNNKDLSYYETYLGPILEKSLVSILDCELNIVKIFNDKNDYCLDYYEMNDDYVNGYDYVLEDTIDLDRAKAYLDVNCSDDDLLAIIKDNYTIERSSAFYPNNAMTFVNIDEIEDQISGENYTGIPDSFIYLKGKFTESEVNEAFELSKASENGCLRGNSFMYRPDFSSIQLLINFDVIQDLLNKKKAA